jgi:hypothetical protein
MCAVVFAASAYGGGGFFQASQVAIPGYSNVPALAEVHGGYGYGASRGGSRYGGFGLAVEDAGSDKLIGAFGGVISGHQVRTGPFTLSVNVWSGIGYVNPDIVLVPGAVGFFAEATGEAGFAILPWMQLSVYAGYQAIGPFDPSMLFTNTLYTPVIGSRLTWGSF